VLWHQATQTDQLFNTLHSSEALVSPSTSLPSMAESTDTLISRLRQHEPD
jgi:hypothetical protein